MHSSCCTRAYRHNTLTAVKTSIRNRYSKTFSPARADLCEVFSAVCNRQDQLDAISESLTTVFSATTRSDVLVAFLHLVTHDFECARQRAIASALAAIEGGGVVADVAGARAAGVVLTTAPRFAEGSLTSSSTSSSSSSLSLMATESSQLPCFDATVSSEDLVFSDGGRR